MYVNHCDLILIPRSTSIFIYIFIFLMLCKIDQKQVNLIDTDSETNTQAIIP